MKTFANKLVVITGGANGIGCALARLLGKSGATIVVADINDPLGEKLVGEINKNGGNAHYQHVDVADEHSMAKLVSDTRTTHGDIDYFFNNAGISVAGDSRDLTLEHWRKVTDVNYWGVVYGSKFAFDTMAEQGHGHIINIASLAGLIPFPSNLPYAATKHAVVGLSLSLRAEGHDLGVKVTAVCPGFIDSNIFEASELVNVPRTDIRKDIPFKLVETDDAAAKILSGVARNRSVIVFPGYARIAWWLHRLKNTFTDKLSLQTIRDMRKMRGKV